MEEEFTRMIQDNQTRIQDQGDYLAKFEQAEARYQRTQAKKEALETEATHWVSRRKTILAAYEQLLTDGSTPVFEPRQFNALTDHATITTNTIRFAFKSSQEIEINLG